MEKKKEKKKNRKTEKKKKNIDSQAQNYVISHTTMPWKLDTLVRVEFTTI